ncbi:FAD-dependent oxidoreductase, partial [Acinetobacter ursingii]|uniref:FAD-dependent oxidoreductase n=1 Tax=Acinetobacter ursingii TaxID=108980 RepID=UPI003AF4CB21
MPRKKEVISGNVVRYDAVVLGSGPAGEGAAMKLAKAGTRVALVDIREQLGGNWTHVGTIPSKALRQTVSS